MVKPRTVLGRISQAIRLGRVCRDCGRIIYFDEMDFWLSHKKRCPACASVIASAVNKDRIHDKFHIRLVASIREEDRAEGTLYD
jgi:hypothetical protein